jgi:hypothetical protein
MLPILDVDAAADRLDQIDDLQEMAKNLQQMGHGMSGESFMGLLIGLVAVILIFGTPIIIALAAFRNRVNKQKLINELVLKLADKGKPIPPELFVPPVRQKSDLRRGIIWAAAGLGVMMFGSLAGENDLIGIGCIPLMVGAGFALAAWLENKQNTRQP